MQGSITLNLDAEQARAFRILCSNRISRALGLQAGISGQMMDSLLQLVNNASERTELTAEEIASVRDAYQHFRLHLGFDAIAISRVNERARVPLNALKAWLLQESRAGRVHLTKGDWSLAPEEARAAAVTINAEPHLCMRLDSKTVAFRNPQSETRNPRVDFRKASRAIAATPKPRLNLGGNR